MPRTCGVGVLQHLVGNQAAEETAFATAFNLVALNGCKGHRMWLLRGDRPCRNGSRNESSCHRMHRREVYSREVPHSQEPTTYPVHIDQPREQRGIGRVVTAARLTWWCLPVPVQKEHPSWEAVVMIKHVLEVRGALRAKVAGNIVDRHGVGVVVDESRHRESVRPVHVLVVA